MIPVPTFDATTRLNAVAVTPASASLTRSTKSAMLLLDVPVPFTSDALAVPSNAPNATPLSSISPALIIVVVLKFTRPLTTVFTLPVDEVPEPIPRADVETLPIPTANVSPSSYPTWILAAYEPSNRFLLLNVVELAIRSISAFNC